MSARFEFRDDATVTLNMPWSGLDGARDLFTCTLDTGDYVGLVWYSFGLERLDGKGRKMFGPYQLTVYDGGEVVPEWFGEGTTYQIFPDRFRRTRCRPPGHGGGRWSIPPGRRSPSSARTKTERSATGTSLAAT